MVLGTGRGFTGLNVKLVVIAAGAIMARKSAAADVAQFCQAAQWRHPVVLTMAPPHSPFGVTLGSGAVELPQRTMQDFGAWAVGIDAIEAIDQHGAGAMGKG